MRLFLITNLLLPFLFAGCSESIQQPLKKDGELVILTRVGVTTYSVDKNKEASGFDHDLVQMFAQEKGLKARFIIAKSDADVLRRLMNGEAHFAAAWQIPTEEPDIRSSVPYFESRNILVTHEASLPITDIKQLANKNVYVIEGSRQETALQEVMKTVPDLKITAMHSDSELDLMEGVEKLRHESALVNNAVFSIGNNFFPELQDSLEIGPAKPIVWLFAHGVDPELISEANSFLERTQKNGEMARLRDRYFGHVDRLTQDDILHFMERLNSTLPLYRGLFHTAQIRTGIDWRLLAALAYQESQWDPLATSPTGVRGIMMLTGDTADSLKVSNRLDPEQSIRAGAQYLRDLRDALPDSIGEPDRTWMALAAYNVGMGHLNAARFLAKTLSSDPDSWYSMKKVLPLLAKPQFYSRLKSGKGRGGEAVIMAENTRVYNDILNRYERPYNAFPPMRRKHESAQGINKRTNPDRFEVEPAYRQIFSIPPASR
ncbi:MAG: membrane-bound lytic murein transglycosylase MltF [Betaproteobacteria bacterium]